MGEPQILSFRPVFFAELFRRVFSVVGKLLVALRGDVVGVERLGNPDEEVVHFGILHPQVLE